MTWVCYECLGDRKRKLPPQDEDSDLDDHLGQVDGDAQQQIQMGLVVRTADPTLLGVDGMQDTMLSCDALREYLEAMLANYRKRLHESLGLSPRNRKGSRWKKSKLAAVAK